VRERERILKQLSISSLINIEFIIPWHATQKLIGLSFFSSSHRQTGSQKLIGLAYLPKLPPQA